VKYLLVSPLAISLFMLAGIAAQEPPLAPASERLTTPPGAVAYDPLINYLPGEMLPVWSEGHLIAYRRESTPSDLTPNLRIFDRSGSLVRNARLWIDGASVLRIYDIAASRDGRVGVVGSAVSQSGELAWFFADISLSGESNAKVVHTSPFEPRSVAFGTDGSVWLLGLQLGPDRHFRNAPDHFIVEHLNRDGTLEGSYLKRSSIACGTLAPAAGGLAKILASDDRIGLFLRLCDTWVELKPNGDLIGSWKWNPSRWGDNTKDKSLGVITAAMTGNDEVYATIISTENGTKIRGLFRLDRTRNDWVSANIDAARETVGTVQGSDEDKLVYYNSKGEVVWVRP
jgi:hypothetical protein